MGNATQDEMENFFGFKMTDSPQKKVETVKKKAQKIEKLEKKENRSVQQQRDIDFFEALGMPKSVTSDPNRKKKQNEESDKSILNSLNKMGVL